MFVIVLRVPPESRMDANEMKKQQLDYENAVRCFYAREEKERIRKARIERNENPPPRKSVPSKPAAHTPPLDQPKFPEDNVLKGFRRW